jgi:hypothetical protein
MCCCALAGSGAYNSVFGPPPRAPTKCAAPSGSVATAWHPNHATASSHSHVTGSSGDSWPANAAWKAADGDLSFASGVDCQHPAPNDACEGWNPFPGPSTGSPEYITFDLQECVQVDGFALWSTGDGVHDAAEMTLQRSDDGVGAWHTVARFNGSSTAVRCDIPDSRPDLTALSLAWQATMPRTVGRPHQLSFCARRRGRSGASRRLRRATGVGRS